MSIIRWDPSYATSVTFTGSIGGWGGPSEGSHTSSNAEEEDVVRINGVIGKVRLSTL